MISRYIAGARLKGVVYVRFVCLCGSQRRRQLLARVLPRRAARLPSHQRQARLRLRCQTQTKELGIRRIFGQRPFWTIEKLIIYMFC